MTGYDAYWFLYDHPKFQSPTVVARSDWGGGIGRKDRAYLRTYKDVYTHEQVECVALSGLKRHALDQLDIFYAKVDETGTVNDDPKKNKNAECWLEFGPIYIFVSNGHVNQDTSHDIRLDCGAATFDEALIKLARLVRKHYGPIAKARKRKKERSA